MLFPNKIFMSNCWTHHVVCQIGANGVFGLFKAELEQMRGVGAGIEFQLWLALLNFGAT